MYVSTFYSFKGGVGRTMAMVNVAVSLAQRGRRVLAVDFDLEAPGLDTFFELCPKEPTPGLVDYVNRYLDTDQAPDVRDFVGKSQIVDNLLVMPSGAGPKDYAANFGQIDWGALYEEHDGYFLFEDLKEQWRQLIEPDYVLIDSRTGYTDTGGICTRQLPDAVTILFFPNEQNLRGLTKVISDIRSETNAPREKKIQIHFVMSNVPDLDDEDDILTQIRQRFRDELKIHEEHLTVHHYNSLSLLNQTVFTQSRPKSRLSQEYRAVADRIVHSNLEDRDGALYYIGKYKNGPERPLHRDERSTFSLSEAVNMIRECHPRDGEVLFHLGALSAQRGIRDAELLLDQAIECGYQKPRAFLERAKLRSESGDDEGAHEDATTVLSFNDLPAPLVLQATRLLAPGVAARNEHWPAVATLDADEQITLADGFIRAGELDRAKKVVEGLLKDSRQLETIQDHARSNLVLTCIPLCEFQSAIDLLDRTYESIDQMAIQDAFNYAMAFWGHEGRVVEAPFKRVVELDQLDPEIFPGANYMQCLAVANWAIGDIEAAVTFVQKAREEAETERHIFSCWRYQTIRRPEFLADIDEIYGLIHGGESNLPTFMSNRQRIKHR